MNSDMINSTIIRHVKGQFLWIYMNASFFFVVFLLLSGCRGNESGQRNTPASPQQLLLEIVDDRRFISTDEVADKIINKDPSIRLVDVRPSTDYQYFALPEAINVPLANTLDASVRADMDFDKYTFVFYSNDDILAEQAWMLNRRAGCSACYIMKGGLNAWVETIMNPQKPPATASSEEHDQYQFRLAASRYFAGGSREMRPEPFYSKPKPVRKEAEVRPKPVKKEVEVKPKKVEEEEEEGC